MKVKHVLLILAALASLSLFGCGGSDANGLNGSITLTATSSGQFITATATYANPTHTNVIGVPITFSVTIDGTSTTIGTFNTNNSGTVTVAFPVPAFNGSQTVLVQATSAKLSDFATVTMTGRTVTVTAPPAMALTAAASSIVPITIPATTTFVTVHDPFTTNLSGAVFAITGSFVSTNVSDTLTLTSTSTTTNTVGIAGFPGATATMTAPATVGGVDTMTITWTVTDSVTGLTGTGITTITLTST